MEPKMPPPPRPYWLVQALADSVCTGCFRRYFGGPVDSYITTIYAVPWHFVSEGFLPSDVNPPAKSKNFNATNVRWWCRDCNPPREGRWDENQHRVQVYSSQDNFYELDWATLTRPTRDRAVHWIVDTRGPSHWVKPVDGSYPGFY